MLRNYINNWIGKQGYIKADKLPRWLLPESEAEKWMMPDPTIYGNQADLYRKLSYIGTVVDIVADACVDADFDITNEVEEEDDNHPFIKLLDKPNPFDSRSEFLRGHFGWRKVTGNSYWYLNRPNANAAPDEIWVLPPSKIIPVPDGRMGLKGYLYTPGNGAEIPLETWEVLHFKSFNPFSRYLGLSAIESLAATSYGAIAAQEWNTRLFAQNNARLPGILAFAEYSQPTDWERIKKNAVDSAEKRNLMMLNGVGKGGVQWMQAAASQREMEFLAGLQMNKQDIYDRLAPGLYNMITSNSSLANGQTGSITFSRYTLMPILRELTDKINADLLPVYGEGWKSEYEDVVPEDKEQEMREIELFAKFHTVDEVRVEKYVNEPDPDPERGKLLVAQVNASTGKPAPEPVQPQNEMMPADPEAPAEPDTEMKADLSRWKRKATKNLGNVAKMTAFESEHIPADVSILIREKLSACKSTDEIALAFDSVSRDEFVKRTFGKFTPDLSNGAEEIKALALQLERAVDVAIQMNTVTIT